MSDDCYIEFISHEYDLRENRFIIPHPTIELPRGKNIVMENVHLLIYAPTPEVTKTLEWTYANKSPLNHKVDHEYIAARCKSTIPDYLEFLKLSRDELSKVYIAYDALVENGIHCGIEDIRRIEDGSLKKIPHFCLYQFETRLTAWPLNPIKLAWLTYIC